MKPSSLVKWETKLLRMSASRSGAAGTSAGIRAAPAVLGSTCTATGSCCGCAGAQRIRTGGPTSAGVISGSAAIGLADALGTAVGAFPSTAQAAATQIVNATARFRMRRWCPSPRIRASELQPGRTS